MTTISLAMIVKDEEDVLGRCLASVAPLVDEIIIVDTGSRDATKTIAAEFTKEIYDFEWVDDFSAARNFAFSKATMDYIMWLDADDFVKPEELEKLLSLKEELDPAVDMVLLKYDIAFDTAGRVTVSNYRERLVKRANNYQWEEPVHETIVMRGNILKSEIAITHGKPSGGPLSDRNLRILEAQEELSPRGLFYYARELKDHKRFEEALARYDEFLGGGEGWIEDNLAACYEAAYCCKELGDEDLAMSYVLQTLLFDIPRANTCCWLGAYFLERGQYGQAIYWYDMALHKNSRRDGGMIGLDYYGYIPHMQLCVAFCYLEQYEQAFKHHLKARELKPDDESVLFNDGYFKELGFEVEA